MTDAAGRVSLFTKEESKRLPLADVRRVLDTFLSPDDEVLRQRRRRSLVAQLRLLLQLMQEQRQFHMISSSLLLAYPGRRGGTTGQEEEVRVTMIDFAHTFASSARRQSQERQVDANYVAGLRSLHAFLEEGTSTRFS